MLYLLLANFKDKVFLPLLLQIYRLLRQKKQFNTNVSHARVDMWILKFRDRGNSQKGVQNKWLRGPHWRT